MKFFVTIYRTSLVDLKEFINENINAWFALLNFLKRLLSLSILEDIDVNHDKCSFEIGAIIYNWEIWLNYWISEALFWTYTLFMMLVVVLRLSWTIWNLLLVEKLACIRIDTFSTPLSFDWTFKFLLKLYLFLYKELFLPITKWDSCISVVKYLCANISWLDSGIKNFHDSDFVIDWEDSINMCNWLSDAYIEDLQFWWEKGSSKSCAEFF